MKHTVQSLTQEVLVSMFGDSKDWYSVLKNGKRVGSFSDLRKRVLAAQAAREAKERAKTKAKEYYAENKDDAINDAKKYFESEIKNGEVFINRTQPNVHINGCKCYIICGVYGKIRLGILHHTLTFDEMQTISGVKGTPNTAKNHILFDNITLDEGKDLINLLCG